MIRGGAFDREAIQVYMEQNHRNDPDYCVLDLSEVKVLGIQMYMDSFCRLSKSMEALRKKFPVYEDLDDVQHQQLIRIFRKHYDRQFDPDPQPDPNHQKN